MTQDRKRGRRLGRGTLAIIAVLLLGSALLRVGLQATEAIAREASPEALAESLPMPAPLAAPQQCVSDPDLVPLLEAMETREDRLRMREERMTMRMRALQVADARIQEKLAELRASEAALRATIALADHVIECLQDHAEKHAEQPFFHYLAFTAPHFPLHALPEDIARYKGVYEEGWERIRAKRWARMQAIKIQAGTLSEVEAGLGPPYAFPDHLAQLGPGDPQ